MNVFQKKHVYFPLLKGVSLILPADMEGGKSGGSGPLPQIDLSVVYKRLRSDGLKKKKEKEQTKACSVRNHSPVSLGQPSFTRRTLPHWTGFSHLPGKGVKRHSLWSEAEQGDAPDRTCFPSKTELIVLSCGAWAYS